MDFTSEPGSSSGARESIERRQPPPTRKAWVRTLTRLKAMIERIAEGDEPTLRGGAHRRRRPPR